jgi:hypothetical protein
MSNCHEELLKFNSAISLSEQEKKKLQVSRDAIISRIKSHFKEKGYKIPDFKGQGSFSMGTSIRPMFGYYDLDLGVYLTGLGYDSDEWPRTETIHNLIFNAVNGHTSIRPIKKQTCVRVLYKSPYIDKNDLSYHVDLPVYALKKSFWSEEIKTVIALKGEKQWSEYSDPTQFTKWFSDCCDKNPNDKNQLKRLVKYLKAWKDNAPEYPKMPSGMILTVLAAKNYRPNLRDDIALFDTVEKFEGLLSWLFRIEKPVEPFNDLSNSMSENEIDNFMQRTEKLIKTLDNAISIKMHKAACSEWRKVFGNRFDSNRRVNLYN